MQLVQPVRRKPQPSTGLTKRHLTEAGLWVDLPGGGDRERHTASWALPRPWV